MRVHVLASGSRGNATLFESGATRVLVDAGLPPRTLARRLRAAGVGGGPTAVVITHAHSDHVGFCARVCNEYGATLYMTEATARMAAPANVSARRTVSASAVFAVGALTFSFAPVPHDAAQVAVVVSDTTYRVALATDLGEVTGALRDHVADCDAWLLESNHDVRMLHDGPYPQHLKARIASARGHLSNAQCAELLRSVPERTKTIVLMHLSETNNRPDLALAGAREALASRRDVVLRAASQNGTLSVDLA